MSQHCSLVLVVTECLAAGVVEMAGRTQLLVCCKCFKVLTSIGQMT